jgi:hypothetical protein
VTTKRRRKTIDDGMLRRLWATKMTEREIAAKMGHRPYTLRRRAIKLGLPRSRRKMWEQQG